MNSELMKHQYAHTIRTAGTGTARCCCRCCSPLHRRVYTSPSQDPGSSFRDSGGEREREREREREGRARTGSRARTGDECCGRNLHRTGCRPLHDRGPRGRRDQRNERRVPPSLSLSFSFSLLSLGSSFSRRARRTSRWVTPGVSCTLRTLHTKRTLNRRGSGSHCGRVAERFRQHEWLAIERRRGDWLSFVPDRKWSGCEGMPLP